MLQVYIMFLTVRPIQIRMLKNPWLNEVAKGTNCFGLIYYFQLSADMTATVQSLWIWELPWNKILNEVHRIKREYLGSSGLIKGEDSADQTGFIWKRIWNPSPQLMPQKDQILFSSFFLLQC